MRLWDVPAGKEQATLERHKGLVLAPAFSPDGKTLASGGRDQTVRLWHNVRLRLSDPEGVAGAKRSEAPARSQPGFRCAQPRPPLTRNQTPPTGP